MHGQDTTYTNGNAVSLQFNGSQEKEESDGAGKTKKEKIERGGHLCSSREEIWCIVVIDFLKIGIIVGKQAESCNHQNAAQTEPDSV
jgi:hypothetical protein